MVAEMKRRSSTKRGTHFWRYTISIVEVMVVPMTPTTSLHSVRTVIEEFTTARRGMSSTTN
jgi:hypothetical protein